MEVQQAIASRRSIRAFKPDPVGDDTLRRVLDAGRLAPSWGNTQTWRFVVIRNPAVKARLAESALRPGNRGTEAVRKAPVVIAACAEQGRAAFRDGAPTTDKGAYWFMFDAGLALGYMTLAAQSLGLGTLFVGGMNAKTAEGILDVPSGYSFVILMTLGYPDEQPEARPRKDLSDIAFREGFGAKY